jgi:N-acetylglucosaminyl-diphospho-decaprenol L-rhamnosyltransferase
MVSIIIVNYKIRKELFLCIESLENSSQNINFEIIVVDNDEKKVIREELLKKFPKIKYIESPKNLGYGAGNNLGVKHAKGEYIFILNPDTEIVEGNISKLIDFIDKNNKIGAVAPLLLGKRLKPYQQGTQILTPQRAVFALSFINKYFPNNKVSRSYWTLEWDRNSIRRVDVVPGTAFVIKKSIFEKIGGFDEKYFLFFEEFDLCIRLKDLGYKNYINPDLKIYHKWGASTSRNPASYKYFLKSRYFYFKKNYGILNASFLELFLRINKRQLSLFLVLLIGFAVRIYNIQKMPFIGDIAWFFISARDILLYKTIPLVGITSSHIWLHQGALWTYILAAIFKVFGFNPILPAFFTILIDLVVIVALYNFSKKYFNFKVALVGSLLYAVSPFIVFTSQIPYHTNLIPLLMVFLITSTIEWIKGKNIYFPICIFILVLLYNFQISSLPVIYSFLMIFLFGLIKHKKWVLDVFNFKIILLSFLALFIPMLPMLIFDINNGFPQTLKVAIWSVYKLAVLIGFPPINPTFQGDSWNMFLNFIILYVGRIYLMSNSYIALVLFTSSVFYILYLIIKNKFKNIPLNILYVFFIIPAIGFIGMKSNSQAYLPMFFPTIILLLSILLIRIVEKKRVLGFMIITSITILNIYSIINYPRGTESLKKRSEVSSKIIQEVNGRKYNLIGVGPTSEYTSFRSPYIYLTWWLGNPPSEENQEIKVFIKDTADIIIKKRDIK